jgi:hypothetical protein
VTVQSVCNSCKLPIFQMNLQERVALLEAKVYGNSN